MAVGQHVRALVGPTKKRLQLELRGKGIAVVFDDADLEDCVNTTMKSSYGHPVCGEDEDFICYLCKVDI